MNNVEFLVQFPTYTAWLTQVPAGHAILGIRTGNSSQGFSIEMFKKPKKTKSYNE